MKKSIYIFCAHQIDDSYAQTDQYPHHRPEPIRFAFHLLPKSPAGKREEPKRGACLRYKKHRLLSIPQ